MKLRIVTTSLVLVFLGGTANAHHSATAIYNREAPVTIRGTITQYEWRNPHVYVWLEEDAGDGDPATWEIEGPPPAVLRRIGWTADTVKVGDRVTVNGLAGRNAARKIALMQTLTKADDTVLNTQMLRIMTSLPEADAAAARTPATGLAGTWTTLLDLALIGQFMVPRPPFITLTEKGQAALDSPGEAADAPAANCIPMSAPLLMLTPDIKSIEVRTDVVLIRGEFDASERTVFMNLDSHDGATQSVQGHSIGRWDDGALVIDTKHFSPHPTGGGLPSGSRKRLIERLELTEDRSRLVYDFDLEDPDYLAAPVAGTIQWAYRPDLEYRALPCDLENARRFAQ